MLVQLIKFALLFCSVSSMSSFRLPARAFTMRGGQVRHETNKLEPSTSKIVLMPVHNNLLIKVKPVLTSTSSGLYIPDQSRERPSEGTVVAVGPGQFNLESGVLMKMSTKVGDSVVYGKYDGTELKYNGEPHQIIKDDDVLLKYTGGEKSIANIECARGYVLIQLPPKESTSASGLVVNASVGGDGSGSLTGVVVRVGPGRQTQKGTELPVELYVGDSVRFNDHDGSSRLKMEGIEYLVVDTLSVLAKWTQ